MKQSITPAQNTTVYPLAASVLAALDAARASLAGNAGALSALDTWMSVATALAAESEAVSFQTGYRHGAAEIAEPYAESEENEAALLAVSNRHYPAITRADAQLAVFTGAGPARAAFTALDDALWMAHAARATAMYTAGRKAGGAAPMGAATQGAPPTREVFAPA